MEDPRCATASARSSRTISSRRRRRGTAARIDPGAEERLIGIDIADSGENGLVQQDSLNGRAAADSFQREFGGQGVGAQAARAVFTGLSGEFDAAEHADIVIDQGGTVEVEERSGVRAGGGVDEELAGHAEVDDQGPARGFALKVNQDEFAVARHSGDAGSGGGFGDVAAGVAHDAGMQDLHGQNVAALKVRGQGADDGFHLREFGHVTDRVVRGA